MQRLPFLQGALGASTAEHDVIATGLFTDKPAKRPEQVYIHQASTTGNQANDSTVEHITRFATCSGSRLARTAIR